MWDTIGELQGNGRVAMHRTATPIRFELPFQTCWCSYRLVWSRMMRSGVTATGSELSVNSRDGKRQGC